jgi:hypothetical protein
MPEGYLNQIADFIKMVIAAASEANMQFNCIEVSVSGVVKVYQSGVIDSDLEFSKWEATQPCLG